MIAELHLQDGFAGETIEILVNGENRAEFRAKTRYQINLAHVEEVDLEIGDTLTVRIKDTALAAEQKIERVHRFYVISKRADDLLVNPTDEPQRYM